MGQPENRVVEMGAMIANLGGIGSPKRLSGGRRVAFRLPFDMVQI